MATRTARRNRMAVADHDAAGAAVAARSYQGSHHLADEAAMGRIWGGIHYEFDHSASKGVCTQVADDITHNQLRPLR